MVTEQTIRGELQELVDERDAEVEREFEEMAGRMEAQEEKAEAAQDELVATLDDQGVDVKAIWELDERRQEGVEDEMEQLSQELKGEQKILLDDTQALDEGALSPEAWYLEPYYTKIYDSSKTFYEGYSSGSVNVWCRASGGGPGTFGSGAGETKIYVDRWYTFVPDVNRYYSFHVYQPYRGYYIVRADDGFFTSKEAKAVINVEVRAHQYNWKAKSNWEVFRESGSNINVNDRYDDTDYRYYSKLLGTDRAYLLVTQEFYVYARGSGSNARLDFSEGSANYLAAPRLTVV